MKIKDDEPKSNLFFRWQIGMIVILLILAAIYFSKQFDNRPETERPDKFGHMTESIIAVTAKPARQEDFPVYLTGLGTVTPLRTVTVRSRVDGELTRVAFKEGQLVQEGDLLAEIDSRPFKAQLMQAEGQLIRDEALLKNAELDLIRYRTLYEQDSIAAQQAVTQESLVKQNKGTVAIDRGLVANAKLQLGYTRITAPITGRMGLRLLDQGNIVHASDAAGLAVITQIQPIAVVFTLPEDAVPTVMQHIHSGNEISIEALDRSNKTKLAEGKLLAVDNQIDTNTGTVKLKGQFDNSDMSLFPNQFVNIKMKMNTLRSVTVIPAAAVQKGSIGSFVYVVKPDQTVSVRALSLGPSENDNTVVLEGLQPGEQVVVDGTDKLRENTKVKLITPDKPAATSGETDPADQIHNDKTLKSGHGE